MWRRRCRRPLSGSAGPSNEMGSSGPSDGRGSTGPLIFFVFCVFLICFLYVLYVFIYVLLCVYSFCRFLIDICILLCIYIYIYIYIYTCMFNWLLSTFEYVSSIFIIFCISLIMFSIFFDTCFIIFFWMSNMFSEKYVW